jgi:amino acid permease
MENPSNMISALLFAYGIHDLIVQNIIKNDNKKDYKWIALMAYIGGMIIYTFVAQGSFGIHGSIQRL